MSEPPAERKQTVECLACASIIDDPTPRESTVEATEHLSRFPVRVLVRASLVASLTALSFSEIRDCVGCRTAKLIGEVTVVHLDALDDWTKKMDELQSNLISNQHVHVLLQGFVRGPLPPPQRPRAAEGGRALSRRQRATRARIVTSAMQRSRAHALGAIRCAVAREGERARPHEARG